MSLSWRRDMTMHVVARLQDDVVSDDLIGVGALPLAALVQANGKARPQRGYTLTPRCMDLLPTFAHESNA